MKQELVEFAATDGWMLPGILMEPEQPTDRVALMLHGNGSSSVFYDDRFSDSVAQALNDIGISYFPFNNRGAHYIKKLRHRMPDGSIEKQLFGMAYELIKECVADLDGAIKYLSGRGYREFILIGHSTGANKICVYSHYQPNHKVSRAILVGPGDDVGIYYSQMSEKKFRSAQQKAQAKIRQGKGRDLMPKYLVGESLLSWQSFWDMTNPDGDYNTFPFLEAMTDTNLSRQQPLFAQYQELKVPTLVVFGAGDEHCYDDVPGVVKAMRRYTTKEQDVAFKIVPNADHSFTDHEADLAQAITQWMTKQIEPGTRGVPGEVL